MVFAAQRRHLVILRDEEAHMRHLRMVGCVTCLLLLSGCVVPLVHVKQTCGPVSGAVVDARTKTPLTGADIRIMYPDGGERKARTDSRGKFRFPAKHRCHWGYLIGIALNYSLPYDCGWFDFTSITVEADGYQSVAFAPSQDRPQPMESLTGEHDDPRGFVTIRPKGDAQGKWSVFGSARSWRYPAIQLPRRATTQPSPP